MLPALIGSSTIEYPKPTVAATYELPEVTIIAKKIKKKVYRINEYLGFKLRGLVNTKISERLKLALADYSGPKVGINSLRRFWSKSSDHYTGNAVDFEFKHELIEWLVSEEGTQ